MITSRSANACGDFSNIRLARDVVCSFFALNSYSPKQFFVLHQICLNIDLPYKVAFLARTLTNYAKRNDF